MPDSEDQIQAAAQAMRELSPDDRTRATDIARNVPAEPGFYFYFKGSGDARPASIKDHKGNLVAYYIGNPRPSGLAGVDQWGPRIPAWDPTCHDKELVWVTRGDALPTSCCFDEGDCEGEATHHDAAGQGFCDFHHADGALSALTQNDRREVCSLQGFISRSVRTLDELTAVQATLTVRTHEVGELRRKLSKADELVTEFMRIRDTVAAQGAEWQASAAERAAVIREQCNEIRELKRQLADAQDTLAVRTQEKANLGRALHDANCHVSSLIERRAKQKAEFAQTSSRLAADLAEESCAKSDALDKVSALTAGIGSLTDEVVTLEGDLHSRCTKLRKERDRVDELEKQLAAATIANDLAVSGNATIVTVLESVKAERDMLRATLGDCVSELTAVGSAESDALDAVEKRESERDDLHKRIHALADEMHKASVSYGESAVYYKPESSFHGNCRGTQAAYNEASQRVRDLIWESSPAPTPDRDPAPANSPRSNPLKGLELLGIVGVEVRESPPSGSLAVTRESVKQARREMAEGELRESREKFGTHKLPDCLRSLSEQELADLPELSAEDIEAALKAGRTEAAREAPKSDLRTRLTALADAFDRDAAYCADKRDEDHDLDLDRESFGRRDGYSVAHAKDAGLVRELLRSTAKPADDEPAPPYDDCGKSPITVAGYVFVGKQARVDGGFYWYEESGLYWTTGGGPQLAPPFTIRSLSKSELATLASHFGADDPPTDSKTGSSETESSSR